MKWRPDWFVIGMGVAIVLAWIAPEAGASGGWLHADLLNKIGVALVFFLSGLSLSFADLKQGTLRWPLHLVVQVSVFLVFPLVGIAALWLVGDALPHALSAGFYFLCVLPSTVSSSVALTAAARGNVPAAVFNATMSSLLGVFITPLWVSWRLQASGQAMPLGEVILDLVLWLLVPLALGQGSRLFLREWAQRNRGWLKYVDRVTILVIIYTSFCDSVAGGVWRDQRAVDLIAVVVGSLVLFVVLMLIVRAVSRALGFNAADRITAMFCGSKKSIAQGVPMARLIFGSDPHVGLMLVPLIVYHQLQLILCSVLAERWSKRKDES